MKWKLAVENEIRCVACNCKQKPGRVFVQAADSTGRVIPGEEGLVRVIKIVSNVLQFLLVLVLICD